MTDVWREGRTDSKTSTIEIQEYQREEGRGKKGPREEKKGPRENINPTTASGL